MEKEQPVPVVVELTEQQQAQQAQNQRLAQAQRDGGMSQYRPQQCSSTVIPLESSNDRSHLHSSGIQSCKTRLEYKYLFF